MKKLLYFSANWCVPCKQMKPIVAELSDTTGVEVEIHDIDDEYELSQKYKVRAVPTFVLVEDEEEISRAAGAQTGKELAAALLL